MAETLTENHNPDAEVNVSGWNSDRFAARLRQIIGDESARSFARRAGISATGLQEMLSGKRPRADNLVAVARAGGVSIDWLATGEVPGTVAQQLPKDGGFVLIPRYDVEASAGPGAFSDREQIVDHMAFREDFVRRTLRVDPARLALITAIGDSMEPAIRAGDLLLIDTSVDHIIDDAIYVLAKGGQLVVKRVQQFFNGAVTVKSDNPAYIEETIGPGEQLRVAGRVRWIGRLI